MHEGELHRSIRLGLKPNALLGHEPGTRGGDGQRGGDAVAIHQREPHHRGEALQVRLLVDTEEGQPVLDVGFDLWTEVEGAVEDVPRLQPRGLNEGVEGIRTVGTQGQEGVDVWIRRVEVVDDGLRLCRIVGDGQHLDGQPCLVKGVLEAVAAGVQPGVPHLMVDAHTLLGSGGDQSLATLVAALILVLADEGHVGDAVLLRPGAGIVAHHRNPGVDGAHDGVFEQHRVRDRHRQAVGVGSHRLVDERGRLLQIELVRTEDGEVHVHGRCSILGALLHGAPEGIPGTQRVLNHDDLHFALLRCSGRCGFFRCFGGSLHGCFCGRRFHLCGLRLLGLGRGSCRCGLRTGHH